MTRTLGTVLTTSLLLAVLAGCGDEAAEGSSGDCTEFAGTETTIGIRHDPGFELDGEVQPPGTGEGGSTLGDLVLPGEGTGDMGGSGDTDDAVLSVYESEAGGDDVGLDAFAAISRHVQRTGTGPANLDIEPLPVDEVEVAGLPAYQATLTTTDGFVYTAWIIPGDERSLDVVLAQTEESAAEADLADEVPDLVEADGCP